VTATTYVPRTPREYLPSLEKLADAMAETLACADLDAAVPDCPGWTVRDLAAHVTHAHRWARAAIVEGHPNTPEPEPSLTPEGACVGYRTAADALLETLRQTDPETGCWAFGPSPKVAGFWFRRQTLEVAVHLVDALAAQGLEAALDQELARDGVDEVVTMFFPRQVRLNRIQPLRHSLAIVAEGEPYRWVLAGNGRGEAATRPDADAEATVSGPASVLLLLLWGRTTLDNPTLTVDGDADAARAVLGGGITP